METQITFDIDDATADRVSQHVKALGLTIEQIILAYLHSLASHADDPSPA
jgi:antitoxin component of RelBE/YafQ-DinJ toxin-antitoxin module